MKFHPGFESRCLLIDFSWIRTEMFARDFLSIFKDRNHFLRILRRGISGNTSSRYLTLSMSSQFHLPLIKIDWHRAEIYIYSNTIISNTFDILSIRSMYHPHRDWLRLIWTRLINNLIVMQLFDVKYSGTLKNMNANMNRHFRKHANVQLNVEKHPFPSPCNSARCYYARLNINEANFSQLSKRGELSNRPVPPEKRGEARTEKERKRGREGGWRRLLLSDGSSRWKTGILRQPNPPLSKGRRVGPNSWLTLD